MMQNKEQSLQISEKLPHLQVSSESYCSQELVDNGIEWLKQHKADLITGMAEYEILTRDHPHYLRDINLILDSLVTEAVNEIVIPQTRLARLDFAHELGRRIRIASNVSDFKMHGKPHLANDLHMVSEAIPEATLMHIQNPTLVLKILKYIYQFQRHLAVERLEEERREIYTAEIANEFNRVLEMVVPMELSIGVNSHLAHQVLIALGGQLSELLRR